MTTNPKALQKYRYIHREFNAPFLLPTDLSLALLGTKSNGTRIKFTSTCKQKLLRFDHHGFVSFFLNFNIQTNKQTHFFQVISKYGQNRKCKID